MSSKIKCETCTCNCDCPIDGDEDENSNVIRLSVSHKNYCKKCIQCILIEINSATEEKLHSEHLCKHGTDIENEACEECVMERFEPIPQCDSNSELSENQ